MWLKKVSTPAWVTQASTCDVWCVVSAMWSWNAMPRQVWNHKLIGLTASYNIVEIDSSQSTVMSVIAYVDVVTVRYLIFACLYHKHSRISLVQTNAFPERQKNLWSIESECQIVNRIYFNKLSTEFLLREAEYCLDIIFYQI